MKNFFFFLLIFLGSLTLHAQEIRVYKEPEFGFDWSKPSEYPDRIVLTFGENATSEVSVNWRTNTEINPAFAELAVASGAPKFWRNAITQKAKTEVLQASEIPTAEVDANYHSATFSNLTPGTVYAYRVGDGTRWSEWFQFKTPSDQAGQKFSFLYVGDAQNYILELWARLIREGFRKAPDADFIIHAGDLINYAHREQEWHEWFTAGGFIHSMLPTLAVPGNHEYNYLNETDRENRVRSLSIQWKPQFTYPLNGPKGLEETAYFIDYPDAKFIFLDSNRDHQIQAEWLEEILKSNTKKWVIVSYHHPLFSASAGRDNEALRNLWKPIFDKYQVDLALQGHDHSYGRGRVSPGENMMDGMNMRDKTGTVYVVSVSGGKMYGIKPDGWEEWGAVRDRAAENTQLFQVITIEENTLQFESYTAIGELYDKFELTKEEDGINIFKDFKEELPQEFRFTNTIPYEDQLPQIVEDQLLKRYPGFQVKGVRFFEEKGQARIRVILQKENESKDLILDQEGRVISEK
ncbi:MAG: fibronectin type III domain-containing protein [Algoriphagus sp.]|uniref:fibronectin type III domain-containing protein n=1 Tax=Algoriphagus sp. TaxID=1872435 RepID=UPI00185DB306|nr:fibronectin type III domain-containing protein [Algoriphagus sp.]NVJ85288.1 fibronectin type III domain-containing protein [Algoriphagus sp.]